MSPLSRSLQVSLAQTLRSWVWCTAQGPTLRGVSTANGPATECTRTVRQHRSGCMPHTQGCGRAPCVQHSARIITSASGLFLVRKLLYQFTLAGWRGMEAQAGHSVPSHPEESLQECVRMQRKGLRQPIPWRPGHLGRQQGRAMEAPATTPVTASSGWASTSWA